MTDRPAVHDGWVMFSVLLLAEFNEGRFLLACTAASAVWGIGRFTWGLNGRLHLPQLPFLLWCLKITHERAHQTKKLLSSSILIQSAGWPLAKLFEHSWPLPPQVSKTKGIAFVVYLKDATIPVVVVWRKAPSSPSHDLGFFCVSNSGSLTGL